MIKTIKNLIVMSIVFLIVFSSGRLKSEELDLPEPDELPKTFLVGSRDAKRKQCSEEVAPALGRKCSFCHNVNATEFTKKGNKAKFMMKAAVALGVKCKFCHAGKKQFTDKLEIAAKMIKLSEMMDVECNFCHAGKGNFTHEGKTAKTAMVLQRWSKNGNKKCLECHDLDNSPDFEFEKYWSEIEH